MQRPFSDFSLFFHISLFPLLSLYWISAKFAVVVGFEIMGLLIGGRFLEGLLIGGGGGFLLQFVGLAMDSAMALGRQRERDMMGWVFCEGFWWC